VRVDLREFEFSCDEEEDCAHNREARIAAGLAFSGLEEAIERFDEAVGLAALCPSDDAVEVLSDHAGDVLHRHDLGPQDVRSPLLEHGGDNVDLLAIEDFAQMLTIKPCAGRAFGGGLGDHGVELGSAFVGQAGVVLEQGPAQPFEARVGALFEAPHLVDSGGGVGATWYLSKVMRAFCKCLVTPLMKAGVCEPPRFSRRPFGLSYAAIFMGSCILISQYYT